MLLLLQMTVVTHGGCAARLDDELSIDPGRSEPQRPTRHKVGIVSHALVEGDQVSSHELAILDEVIAKLSADSTLGQALASARNSLCEGRPAVISGLMEEVSPAQAAKYLGVSRPTVYKLISAGEIPSHLAGTHHRIVMRDLVGYSARRDVARRELAETFAHAAAAESDVERRLADVDRATADRLGL